MPLIALGHVFHSHLQNIINSCTTQITSRLSRITLNEPHILHLQAQHHQEVQDSLAYLGSIEVWLSFAQTLLNHLNELPHNKLLTSPHTSLDRPSEKHMQITHSLPATT